MSVDSLRDGFVSMCFDTSLNVSGQRPRVVLEGQRLGSGSAPYDKLVKVPSANAINGLFGEGSILAESARVALECCDSSVDIYAIPRQDPTTGAATRTYTLTVAGAATSDGKIDIYMGESRWNISVDVASGATANSIASAIQAAVKSSFPFTASVSGAVVTLTAKNAGGDAGSLVVLPHWHNRSNYFPEGVTVTYAQGTAGAGFATPLTAEQYKSILGECCVCALVVLSQNNTLQKPAAAFMDGEWDCDAPQCFGHVYTYNRGTVGNILPRDTNSFGMSRLAHITGDPVLPYLTVTAYAVKSCCATQNNPELSIQGPQNGLLDCLKFPAACKAVATYSEQEQLRNAGFVVTVPASTLEGTLTSHVITNDITNGRFDTEGRQNLTFQSVASRRLAAFTATQISTLLQEFNGLGYFANNTSIREGALGANKKMILGRVRAWAKTQVGKLFADFENMNTDITLQEDFEVKPACQGTPGVLYLKMTYRPPVRIRRIGVTAAPQLLSNCNN